MDASDDEDEKIAKELAQKLSSRPDLSNDAHEPRHLREKSPKPSKESPLLPLHDPPYPFLLPI